MNAPAKRERAVQETAPMVRALLDGRKTQTRRIVKLQNNAKLVKYWAPPSGRSQPGWADPGVNYWTADASGETDSNHLDPCPYGQPGDRLWVKETWTEEHPLAIQDGRYSQPGRAGIPGPPGVTYRVIYRADGEPLQVWRTANPEYPYFTRSGPADEVAAEYPTICSNYHRHGKAIYWCSLRNMPRWASRITLDLIGIRVERLQDISEEDAWSEGIQDWMGKATPWKGVLAPVTVHAYASFWESINGPGSWEANPWVWVLAFRKIEL